MAAERPAAPALPERIDAVLLDAGGVLLDLDYRYLRRLIAPHHRAPIDETDLSRAEALARMEIDRSVREGGSVSGAWRDYFHAILGRVGVNPDAHDGIIDALWEANERVGLWTVATPHGPATVAELKRRGFRVGVVSNAEGQVARDLDNAGYRGLFETVVDSHLVGVEKPDPAIFEIALERMALRPETAVFLGDVPSVDIVGARAAGLAPILMDRHDLCPDVDALRVRSIEELPGLLERTDRSHG
jgi:putative hydrolase of the HAD superfamily